MHGVTNIACSYVPYRCDDSVCNESSDTWILGRVRALEGDGIGALGFVLVTSGKERYMPSCPAAMLRVIGGLWTIWSTVLRKYIGTAMAVGSAKLEFKVFSINSCLLIVMKLPQKVL